MKRTIAFLFFVAITGLAFVLPLEEMKTLNIGDAAPLADRKMTAVDGKEYSLNDLKQENGLIVVFSCNTCPFVVGSDNFVGWEGQYNLLSNRASAVKMGFVLVNSNEAKRTGDDSMDAMKKRAAEKGYVMPYVVDNQHELADACGAKTTPHVFVFDKEMKLIYTGAIDNTVDGKRKQDEPFLLNAIQDYLGGNPVKQAVTPPRGCSIKRVVKQ
jgi:thioredoxin-related protein